MHFQSLGEVRDRGLSLFFLYRIRVPAVLVHYLKLLLDSPDDFNANLLELIFKIICEKFQLGGLLCLDGQFDSFLLLLGCRHQVL